LLVLLRAEVGEEGEDALEGARARVEQQIALRFREVAPRDVERDAALLRELGERAALVVVARLGPRIERAFGERALGVRDDESLVVLERRAETVAGGASAARIVEREELRRRCGRGAVAFGALEARGKAPRVLGAVGEEREALAVALGERGG